MQQSDPTTSSRRTLFGTMITCSSLLLLVRQQPALAFEGGIGGLGKTKPETGVKLWNEESAQIQNNLGIVTVELNVSNRPVLTSFQSPWPLLATGVETRNIRTSDSAFLQVVQTNINPTTKAALSFCCQVYCRNPVNLVPMVAPLMLKSRTSALTTMW